MNYNLDRVQVYLDPYHVSQLDQIAKTIRVKRSQIIRDAVSAIAQRYTDVTTFLTPLRHPKSKNAFLTFAGIGISKTGKLSENIDEIYQHD